MRTKMESGFEDISRSFFVDFGAILMSILAPKINKTKLKIKRILEAIWDAILDDFEIKWARPGGMREAAGGLNSLTESDKS